MREVNGLDPVLNCLTKLNLRTPHDVIFAAATGLRPGEWIALERRDVDRDGRVVYVRRAFIQGELKRPKTDASLRAVPLQARALDIRFAQVKFAHAFEVRSSG
jgi:integrase